MSLRRWSTKRRRQARAAKRRQHTAQSAHDCHRLENLESRVLLSASTSAALGSGNFNVDSAWFATLTPGNPIGEAAGKGTAAAKKKKANKSTILFNGKTVEAVSNQWIVRLKKNAASGVGDLDQINTMLGLEAKGAHVVKGLGLEGMVLVEVDNADSAASLGEYLQDHGKVEYIAPNSFIQPLATTNDPQARKLWGLNNPQYDYDVDANEAWDITTGDPSLIIGVIDTGVDYDHPDLAANMWVNPGETPGDGIDNDGNGFIDDVHGYDFYDDDGDPMDDEGHGTHVAGTIAAVGDNSIGVTGVAHTSKIMAIRFLGPGGGTTDDAIASVNYATMQALNFGHNMPITNNSWGGGAFNQGLYDAIAANEAAGLLFVAAAGNDYTNNDFLAHFPSNYGDDIVEPVLPGLDNVIAVGALNVRGNKAGFSNYGANSVDIFGPGVNILSTWVDNRFQGGGKGNGSYKSIQGTSMASPHVAGVAALIKSYDPSLTVGELKQAVMAGAKPVKNFQKWAQTGGMASAYKSLMYVMETPGADVYEANNSIAEVDAQSGANNNKKKGGKRAKQDGTVQARSADLGNVTDARYLFGANMVDDPTMTDWYRFEIEQFGDATSTAEIEFNHEDGGDLNLFLYDGDGVTQLAASETDGDSEMVSFAGLPPGQYYLKVVQADDKVSPSYNLTVSAPAYLGDVYENNDTPEDVLVMVPKAPFSSNIGPLTKTNTAVKNLDTLDNTADYYMFELLSDSVRPKDNILMKFKHKQGDLDMFLTDLEGNIIDMSLSVTNGEQIFLQGLTKGKYMLMVEGYLGAANPNYSLHFKAPKPPKDRAGDRASKAREMGRLLTTGVFEDYVGIGDELDFYRLQAGNPRILTATLSGLTGAADLFLTDNRLNIIASSELPGTEDDVIDMVFLERGVYYLIVAAEVDDLGVPVDSASYTLTVDAPVFVPLPLP